MSVSLQSGLRSALEASPALVRAALAKAILSLDAARIGAAVARVTDVQHPALGAALAQHACSRRHTVLLQAPQLGRADRLKDEAPHG